MLGSRQRGRSGGAQPKAGKERGCEAFLHRKRCSGGGGYPKACPCREGCWGKERRARTKTREQLPRRLRRCCPKDGARKGREKPARGNIRRLRGNGKRGRARCG